MFDVGFTELLLVFVIGLLILGPERLPRVAAQLGRWVAKARRTANQLRYQLEREVALDEIYKAQKKKSPQKRPGATAPGAQSADAAGGTTGTAAASSQNSAGQATTPDVAADAAAGPGPAPADGPAAATSAAEAAAPATARPGDSSHAPSSPTSERLEVATAEAVENVGDNDGRIRQSESSR